jgi:ferric-dicitrate binding protein FerR (iron transport regulator)
MSQARCERLWQVEANLDGRLSDSDRTSFERHVETCPECQSALAAERRLLETMGALRTFQRSELEQRRARNALLRAADERLVVRAGGRSGLRARAPWLGLALAAAATLLFWARPWREESVPVATATYEVAPEGTADYAQEVVGSTTQIAFRSGKAGFHVEHLEGPARFVVALPDGQLEVRGTRFVVDVVEGRTREVTVSEGAVALSLPGFTGLLRAGERWPAAVAAAAPAGPSAPPPSPAESEVSAAPPPPPSAALGPAATQGAGGGAVSPAPAPAPPGAGARFAEAMGAFSAGNYGRADSLFAAFVRDFPRDGRAEDAMFLRADARARRGDGAGAAAAAREYLAAFPRGLRRPEAERMAQNR